MRKMRSTFLLASTLVLTLAWPVVANAAPDGKALYGSKCASCHESDGVPKKMGAGSKAFGDPEFKAATNADAIVKITLEGQGKMKPVKSVSQEDASAIAAYILTIGAK
jgi:mono/diheme cytochrome c family protein